MSSQVYVKDTKKFWQERDKARAALDRKRASAPYAEKLRVTENLREDTAFLKTGRIVSSSKR